MLPKGSCPEQGSLGLQFSLCTDPSICHSSSNVTVAPGNMRHKGHCYMQLRVRFDRQFLGLVFSWFSAPAAFCVGILAHLGSTSL